MSERSLKHHVVEDNPWECYDINVDTLRDRDAVVASVRFQTQLRNAPHITATGSAKRLPGDRHDQHSGELLAIGRALIALGQHFEAAGNERVDG